MKEKEDETKIEAISEKKKISNHFPWKTILILVLVIVIITLAIRFYSNAEAEDCWEYDSCMALATGDSDYCSDNRIEFCQDTLKLHMIKKNPDYTDCNSFVLDPEVFSSVCKILKNYPDNTCSNLQKKDFKNVCNLIMDLDCDKCSGLTNTSEQIFCYDQCIFLKAVKNNDSFECDQHKWKDGILRCKAFILGNNSYCEDICRNKKSD